MSGAGDRIAGTFSGRGRARARPLRPVAVLALLLASAWPARADDLSVSVVLRDKIYEVRGRFTTLASRDTVWRVLTDYERIPGFVGSMKHSTVEHRDGPRVRVNQSASIGVFPMRKTARLALDVFEEQPNRLAFRDTLGQDFRLYSGSWELQSDSARTTVIYTLEATPKAPVPSWIGRSMMSHAATDLLRQVHAEIERRAIAR